MSVWWKINAHLREMLNRVRVPLHMVDDPDTLPQWRTFRTFYIDGEGFFVYKPSLETYYTLIFFLVICLGIRMLLVLTNVCCRGCPTSANRMRIWTSVKRN